MEFIYISFKGYFLAILMRHDYLALSKGVCVCYLAKKSIIYRPKNSLKPKTGQKSQQREREMDPVLLRVVVVVYL
jgi:hypothetical protein